MNGDVAGHSEHSYPPLEPPWRAWGVSCVCEEGRYDRVYPQWEQGGWVGMCLCVCVYQPYLHWWTLRKEDNLWTKDK